MAKKSIDIGRLAVAIFVSIIIVLVVLFPILMGFGLSVSDTADVVNSLFTAFAFAGLIITLILQKQDLALQREELELTREELAKTAIANTISARISAVVNLMNMPELTEEAKAEIEKEIDYYVSSKEKSDLEKVVSEKVERSTTYDLGLRLDSKVEYLLELSRLQARLRQIDRQADDDYEVTLLTEADRREERMNEAVSAIYGRSDWRKATDPYEVHHVMGVLESLGKTIETTSVEEIVSNVSMVLAVRDGMLQDIERERRKDPDGYQTKLNQFIASERMKSQQKKKE